MAGRVARAVRRRRQPAVTTWCPTEDELRNYLGAACGSLAQAVCELRPKWEEVVRYPAQESSQAAWERSCARRRSAA